MSGNDWDLRRQARLLTDEDLEAIRRLIEAFAVGGEGGRPAVLLRDLTFSQAVGGIAAGTKFPIGTPHDALFELLAKKPLTLPVYTAPELFLSAPLPVHPEIGSLLSPTLTPAWIANDAGQPATYVLKKNGLNMFTSGSPAAHTEPPFSLTGTTVTYQAVVHHAAGAVKKDSEGAAYPVGMIQAGTVSSNTISIAGRRYGFFGSDSTASIPATSADVRDLPGKLPMIENGTEFTITTAAGARRITFWYPNTCRDVSSVKYVEQGGAEYKDMFEKTAADVEGANGHAAAPYKGFTWVLAVASPTSMTFTVHV